MSAGRTSTRPHDGSLSSHLSLREGSEKPPFPLALDRAESVLAVKGPLRRFAPLTAPVRCEGMTVYEGKGGVWISASDFISRHEKWQLETRPYFSMENADWEALEPLAAETGRQAA